MTTWRVGNVEVQRVGEPDFDVTLPQDDATTTLLAANRSWLAPYLTDENALLIGSSATVLRSEGRTIVVDPFLAFEPPDADERDARIERCVGALRAAGVDPADVDDVVLTHLDGLGTTTAFPNARYLLNGDELRRGDAVEQAAIIQGSGQLETIVPDHAVTSDVRIELAIGHSPSHCVVIIESDGELACIGGHLFLHPAQVSSPEPRAGLDEDPEVAAVTRRVLLARLADAKGWLIGPLWAAPGAGIVERAGERYQLSPSS